MKKTGGLADPFASLFGGRVSGAFGGLPAGPAAEKERTAGVGDHPVLDLLNTVARVRGEPVDRLQTDRDVLRWLTRCGWPMRKDVYLRPLSLLKTTRILREAIRTLVEKRKAGEKADVSTLNDFLALATPYLQLTAARNGKLRLKREWRQQTLGDVLAPAVESAAELLTMEDFDLVRRCENEECVLWFYDRTRSHHRRWCSMGTCGNRNKAAAFRERRQSGAPAAAPAPLP